MSSEEAFRARFDALAAIGRDPAGGWSRFAWTPEDAAARDWFRAEAAALGLEGEVDRNGSVWAWWRPEGAAGTAVVTGSHLDTVPNGGAYDGALGVVSGLCAVEALQAEGYVPARPLAVVAFADEEGARFNTPCCASGLMVGELDAAAVVDRRDAEDVRLGDAVAAFGLDPDALGPDPDRLAGLACVVELHVEQGRGLADLDEPLAVGTGIWPHGRWRLTATGAADHAGTTRLADRRDPVLVVADAATAARSQAARHDAVATIGKVSVEPGAANGIAASATCWLDARAPGAEALAALVAGWQDAVRASGREHGVEVTLTQESHSPAVAFDPELRERVATALTQAGFDPPALATAAGHDAGALAAAVPTAMLFVRNPTGSSHTPAEHATDPDCLAGIDGLAAVLADLAGAVAR